MAAQPVSYALPSIQNHISDVVKTDISKGETYTIAMNNNLPEIENNIHRIENDIPAIESDISASKMNIVLNGKGTPATNGDIPASLNGETNTRNTAEIGTLHARDEYHRNADGNTIGEYFSHHKKS